MRRRGHKNAVVAVAHAILRTVYHVLLEHTTWDLGPDYYDRRHTRSRTGPSTGWNITAIA